MELNPKPFKTIEQQVALLESRGVSFSDKNRAKKFLLRENYYAVVNGYKDIFIDRQETNLAKDDRYKPGTDFGLFETVYMFDKGLRNETMGILLEAENALKTATVYAFCSVHNEPDAYLDPANYCSKADYRPENRYTRGLIKLLSTLQGIRDNRPHKQYIEHYNRVYKCLPLWVASKCLTFGNMSAFFDYQQQNVKTQTCIALSQSLGKQVVKQRELAFAYHTLPDFRNICAHDERLYCAKVGKQHDRGFDQLLRALKTATQQERLASFATKVIELLDEAKASREELEPLLLTGMGVTRGELEHVANDEQ